MRELESILVLLAAGKSSRMGRPKACLPVEEQTLLEFQLRRFAAAGGKEAVVVLGCHLEAVLSAHPWLNGPATEFSGLFVHSCVNDEAEAGGSFSSLRLGLISALRTRSPLGGIFVLPIDTPAPTPKVWQALEEKFSAQELSCVLPRYHERGGHPVLLHRSFAQHLLSLDPTIPDRRLDLQIQKLPEDRKVRQDVDDPWVRFNLNSPTDFENWVNGGPVLTR